MSASVNEILIVAAFLLGAVVLGLPAAIRASRLLMQGLSFPREGPPMTSDSWRILAAVALWGISAGVCAASWVVEGRVVGVSDGDTVTVLDRAKVQHKIRLSGIDAPEKGQAFGNASKENLSRLVFDSQVEAYCHKKDRYGREVCKVMRGSSDVNLVQIRAGMAWWYREYANEQTPQEREDYAREEEGAKASRVGLWTDAKPMPPWKWRKEKGSKP